MAPNASAFLQAAVGQVSVAACLLPPHAGLDVGGKRLGFARRRDLEFQTRRQRPTHSRVLAAAGRAARQRPAGLPHIAWPSALQLRRHRNLRVEQL
jgi:hypothetical protein